MASEYFSFVRQAGIPLNVLTARGMLLSIITREAPELLEATASDGLPFRCSESFTRKFLKRYCNMVPRSSTRAAQKTPPDAGDKLYEMWLRLALGCRDSGVRHGDLIINFDQTNVVVADNSARTFDVRGSKQVGVTGKEEKRSWTAVNAISAAGHMLPTQIIMKGVTVRSLPSPSSPDYDQSLRIGFRWSLNRDSSWSNIPQLRELLRDIIVPFFEERKRDLGYPDDQECFIILDCWAVHRSLEFRELVFEEWPWLRLRFVPGGCTGLGQPCDVGIQRVYKHSIRRSQLEDIVREMSFHLEGGGTPETLKLDTTIGTLRDRSPHWFVKAYNDTNDRDLILKACTSCSLPSESFFNQ